MPETNVKPRLFELTHIVRAQSKHLCAVCDQDMQFCLSSGKDNVVLNVTDVLRLLKTIQNHGLIPTIDQNWWTKAVIRYGQDI